MLWLLRFCSAQKKETWSNGEQRQRAMSNKWRADAPSREESTDGGTHEPAGAFCSYMPLICRPRW
jgi:hypothetical protein